MNSGGAEILAHIAPLVIRSADEESRFWERKEAYVQLLGKGAELEEELADATHDIAGEKETAEKAPRARFYILLSLLFGLLMAVGLWWWIPGKGQAPPDELEPVTLIVGCRDSLALNFDPTATADCPDCCIYEIIGCRDSTSLNFDPKATVACDDCCQYPLRPSLVNLAKRDSFSVPPPPPVYDYLAPGPLTPINTTWLWLARYKSWLSWLIPLLVLCISIGWWLWQRDRRDYLARRTRSDEPPYRLPIKIRRDRQLEMDEQFFYLIDQLRGREVGERVRIDLPTTIKATIQKGGFPQLRFRPYTRPTDYLILIDKQAEYNHQSQLFEYVYQHFVRQEVHAERFFFDGDPSWCWNDRQPKGFSLEQLLQRYSQARLLIFANGYSFIDPISGELEPWVKLLQGWQQRALITPAAAAQWNYREAKLSEHLQVLPAGIQGMLQLVNHFESLSTPSLREWKYELGADDQTVRIDESQVVADLQRQLSPALVRWIAACAIYPELHWDLTLEIGETLGAEDQSIPFSEVRQLARLPWFREGYMPQGVRSQLLESELLSVEEEQAVRTAIVDILLANAPSKTDSYAYEEHQLHLAINQLLLNQFTADRRKWLERYQELHHRGLREDVVSMAALDRQYNRRLDFRLPSRMVKSLFAGGRRLLGGRSSLPLYLSLMLGALAWGLVQFLPEPCAKPSPPLSENKGIYCLSSPEEFMRYYALQSYDALERGSVDLIYRLDSTLLSDEFQPLDTAKYFKEFLEPVVGRVWDKAQQEYRQQNYPAAARHFALAHRLIAGKNASSTRYSPIDGINAYQCLNWQGTSYFLAKQRPTADSIASLLQKLDLPDSVSYPTLITLLDYDYVDSVAFGRIRVRTIESRYGFLDAVSGKPTWSGEEAPYEHAFHFQLDSLSQDTLALVTENREQCFVDLSEQNKQRCFSQLIRFQNRDNDLYGYVNEGGTIIIPAVYETAGEFTEDELAWVQRPGEAFGYIRLDGSSLLGQNALQAARDFKQGLAAVKQNNLWGYLNTNGAIAIPPQFTTARDFNADGLAVVIRDSRSYVIDRGGDCVSGDCPTLRFRGQVLDAITQAPIAGANIQAGRADQVTNASLRSLAGVPSNGEGRFVLELSEETPQIQARITATDYLDTLLRLPADTLLPIIYLRPRRTAPEDRDSDGVPNVDDRCPDEAGSVALRGCPDQDNDGIADIDDRCPSIAGTVALQGCPSPKGDPIAADMVQVPGGNFTMGCQEERDTNCAGYEKPAHEVTIPTFYMSKYEVTQAQWRAVMGSDPPALDNTGCDKCPVEDVSWNDIQEFLIKLNTLTGQRYRLPTEAEWEYAARGGAKSQGFLYSGSNDINEVAWYNSNYKAGNTHGNKKTTRPVGGKKANELGLYDMSGNVYEWCADDWHNDYNGAPTNGSAWVAASRGSIRVLRGGGWGNDARSCRAAGRGGTAPTSRGSVIGFRLARS